MVFGFIANDALQGADDYVYIVPGAALLNAPDRVLRTTIEDLPGWRIAKTRPVPADPGLPQGDERVYKISVIEDLTGDGRRDLVLSMHPGLVIAASEAMPTMPSEIDLRTLPLGSYATVSTSAGGFAFDASEAFTLPLGDGRSNLLVTVGGLPSGAADEGSVRTGAMIIPHARWSAALDQNGNIDSDNLALPPCAAGSDGRLSCE